RRVIVVVEFHVVIDVHPRRFPRSELVAGRWQWLQRSAFELLEQVSARDGLATKTSGVDQGELLGDGRVQLGQRKELPVAQRTAGWCEYACRGCHSCTCGRSSAGRRPHA